LLTVELGFLEPDATADHQINHNYFGDIAPHEGTDNETIRVGFSGDQNKPATCVVRQNYFVRCNGENEIISNKSSYNVYEKNTFRQCDGALVLRHGHHATVAGNFFFGDGAENSGGIRVVDSHHKIVNNYLQDLTGTTWNAAFSFMGGSQPSGGSQNGYQAVDDITVMHNSIVNCQQSIFLNKAKGSRAPTGLMANNLIVSSSGPLITENLSTAKLQWVGNLMYGAPVGAEIEASTADPKLSEREGLLRPDEAGPAANAAIKQTMSVASDIDGQTRPDNSADIGADEVSGAIGERLSVPLTPNDVGVSFLPGDGVSKN
jgi:poly(beta-D-mannuronate) lyase